MASGNSNIILDCPHCNEQFTVPSDSIGSDTNCPHCGYTFLVPRPLSVREQLLFVGGDEEDEIDHPGTLKIDGISGEAVDGKSWHIKCHICDSVLLVTKEQVGTEVKCNDCFTMLRVRPNKAASQLDTKVSSPDLKVKEERAPVRERREKRRDDSDELTLMPAVELSPEITESQKESFLDDSPMELVEENLDEFEDEPIALMDPLDIPKSFNPMFGPPGEQNDGMEEEDDDDDSDEMIELLDVSPEELNRSEPAFSSEPKIQPPGGKANNLPRIPRKGKQPSAIPVADDEEAPVRVHAKRRRRKEKASPERSVASREFQFDEHSVGAILDKALGMLKSGRVLIWAAVAIALMAAGSSLWHWILPDAAELEGLKVGQKMLRLGASYLFGKLVFFAGYTLLLFAGGVVFREAARGETKVKSVSVSDSTDFTSTMLLFGFSMFIAALPFMFVGLMLLSLPFQFFLAGFFLFSAWKNQGAFAIISGSIVESVSDQAKSWKVWVTCTALVALGGFVGGGLMDISLSVVSVFTSIVGAVIVAFATLIYAAITGWHCGQVVEQLQDVQS